MADFEAAFRRTLGFEGGFSDDAWDPGGKTRFGITEEVAREEGYAGEMRDLSIEFAQATYRKRYWTPLSCDGVTDQLAADILFDGGVNQGIGTVAGQVQRALNALNDGGKRWRDMVVDADFGPASVGALNLACGSERNKRRVLLAALGLRVARYVGIAERNAKLEAAEGGWMERVAALLAEVLKPGA